MSVELEAMLRRRKVRNLAAGYGGTAEEIDWYNRECVSPQHARFNTPSAQHADLLIPNGAEESGLRDEAVSEISAAVRALLR